MGEEICSPLIWQFSSYFCAFNRIERCVFSHIWLLQLHGLSSPPGSSVHGIFLARLLEQIAISFFGGSSLTQRSNPHLLHLLRWQANSLLLVPPEWTPGDGDEQGGLVCCDSWGRKESDMTEWLNWTELSATWEAKHSYQNFNKIYSRGFTW